MKPFGLGLIYVNIFMHESQYVTNHQGVWDLYGKINILVNMTCCVSLLQIFAEHSL